MPSTFCGETSLFGIRISFESNHPAALHSALSAFLKWNCTESQNGPLVYIVLVAGEANLAAADCFKMEGGQLEIVRAGIKVRADGKRGHGTCTFPAAAVASEAFADAIKTVVLYLVAQAGRIPVHASAIVIDDRALVLAGRSNSGKSALAMAANQAGLPVLSEDTVFVQIEPSFCLWGFAEAIHLLETDTPSDIEAGTRLRSGRLKRVIPIANLCHKADEAVLVVLAQGDRVVLEKFEEEHAVRALTSEPEPGFEFYGARMEAAVRAIAAAGCWRLTLSNDPNAAIVVLVDVFSGFGRICRSAGGNRD
jgi:hypothetical protein